MKQIDIVWSFITIAIAVFCLSVTYSFPNVTSNEISHASIPRFYAIALIILAIVLLIKTLKSKANYKENSIRSGWKQVFLIISIMFLYILLIPIFGFYPMTILFVIGALFIGKIRRFILLLTIPISVVLFVYIFFEKILRVPLPYGSFFS